MPYTPTVWVDNTTLVDAAKMNKIETGIVSLSAPAPSTTPPASPADGDIWYLPADAAGTVWQMRYNASAPTYKWEFVGGSEAFVTVLTDEATTNGGNTFMNMTTVGPRLLVPRAGDYDAWGGTSFYCDTATQALRLGIAQNASAVFAPEAAVVNPAANLSMAIMTSTRLTSLIVGDDVRLLYAFQGGGTKHVVNRWIRVRPVRIS